MTDENSITLWPKLTRVEVIDQYGRQYVALAVSDVRLSVQDAHRTLKIFLQQSAAQSGAGGNDDGH
jgi:hypothetical protein